MSPAARDPEPWELLLARVLLVIDGLAWLGLAVLALIDHLVRHQFDCYAGCSVPGISPRTGFKGAINDPAVIAGLLVALVQVLLAWRLVPSSRRMSLATAGFQLVATIVVIVTTFARLPAIAAELSLLAGAPALAVAGLVLSNPARRHWHARDLAGEGPAAGRPPAIRADRPR